MSIRRTFLLLIAPLFLLLAGVNGALLYIWERAEAERGLANQAIAAAVTVAAFADASEDLARALADPVRGAALSDAVRRVKGLQGLYLVRPDGRTLRLAGDPSRDWPGRFETPRTPAAAGVRADSKGLRRATGLAPVRGGGFVIAQIDAEPLFAQVKGLQRLVAGLVAAAGLVGLVLALAISRIITGELARNSGAIAAIRADGSAQTTGRFAIRETGDLAQAVRLMATGVASRIARGRRELARRDRARDEAVSAAAYRDAAFPAEAAEAAGASVAMRVMGGAPPGVFHALSLVAGRAAVVVGECGGESPSAALASALAARRLFEARLAGEGEALIAQATAAFGITRLAWRAWASGDAPSGLLLVIDGDKAQRAEVYDAAAAQLGAAAVLDDLSTLLEPVGVAAAIRPRSGQRGEG
ncbi:hypothetical protein [Phenylobacterium sp.]|uniref:hypothetical protein n=1 Tax=Phenylobacterium sp. TaxID=1871053 RepID=UPI0025FC2F26|nr:hypothetical protein [Phenylobacterium sp.]